MDEHILKVERSARVLLHGDATAAKIWFVLHGYAQSAREMLEACAALARPGVLLVAPEALSRFYRRSSSGPIGASWMTRELRAAEIEDYVAYLDQVARWCENDLGVHAGQHAVLGFSQGAATAWRWAALGTTRLDRVLSWGGNIPPDLDLAAVAEHFARVQVELVRGRRDTWATSEVFDRDRQRLAAAGIACGTHEFEGGHEVDASALARLA